MRRTIIDNNEEPVAAASLEEFLDAFPTVMHELSEALTAISAYLRGSRQMFERGGRSDGMQSAIEQADIQARRASKALMQLRGSFAKLGRR